LQYFIIVCVTATEEEQRWEEDCI